MLLLSALDDEASSAGGIKFEEMDGNTVRVSLLAAAVPLYFLRHSGVEALGGEAAAIGVLPALVASTFAKDLCTGRGEGAATPPSLS
jgi:hypothetical protein